MRFFVVVLTCSLSVLCNADVVFQCSYDKGFDADTAAGDTKATVVGRGVVLTKSGTGCPANPKGEAFDQQNNTTGGQNPVLGHVSYNAANNVNYREGAVGMWVNMSQSGRWNLFWNVGGNIWANSPGIHLYYRGINYQTLLFTYKLDKTKYRLELEMPDQPIRGQWHFIGASWKYNPDTQTMHASLFLDDKVVSGSAKWPGDDDWTKRFSNVRMWIGSGKGGYRPANSMIDEVRVWNTCLSPKQIQTYYNGISPSPVPQKTGIARKTASTAEKTKSENSSPDQLGPMILPVPQLSRTPTIDGKIDPWIQNEAFHSDRNSMFLLWTLKPADNGTTVFCGKTNGKLYVAVRCEYPKSSPPVCRGTKRDNGSITRDDCIELFLAGENTNGQKDIFHWIVNSGGTFFDECNRKVDWNGKVVPQARLTKEYWDVEFLIDPATLGLKRDSELRLNVNRHDNAPIPSQLSSFLPNNTTTFHVPYDVLVRMQDAPIPAKLTMSEKFLAGGGRNGFHSSITFNDKLGPVEVTSVVFRASDGKLLDKKQVNNVQGRIGFDHEIIEVADYVQQVTLSKNGKVLAKLTKPIQIQPDIALGDTEEKDFSKKSQKYEWVGNQLGIDDTVPAPWTPVEFSKDKISVLGREYLLGKDSLFQQIIADKQPLLATPINLFMKSGWKTIPPAWSDAKVIHKGRDKVVFSRDVKWGNIANGTVKLTCEFDGFVWCEMDISAQGKVNAFWCTVPMTPRVGKYFDTQQLEPNEKIDLAFRPYHWLGNEDVGLRVCPGESDEFWSLKNLRQACQVLCSEKQTEMRLNFITTPPRKRQLKYAWGLQATPAKPVPQNVDLMATVCVRDPQTAQNLLSDYVGQPEKFTEWLRSQGVKTLIIFHYFQKFHGGHIPALDPKITKDLVRDAGKAGIRCLLYRSREFGELDPLWKDWAKRSLRAPTNYGCRQTWPIQQTAYEYCSQGKLADYMVWSCKKLMEEYGFKGMYYDITVFAAACINSAHGCGYVDEKSGLRRPTYPILANRDLMKRLYKVIKSQSPDAVIDAHGSPGPSPSMSFLDSVYYGEQFYNFERFDKDPLKIIPLAQFRAEFLGKAKGVTTCFLCYPGIPFSPDEANAIAFIHGVTARPHNMRNPQSRIHLMKTAPIWKALRDFQIEKAEFHPYWEKGRTIHYGAEPKNNKIYISYYQRENETLYLASNFNIHTSTIYLRDDQRGKNIQAVDALTGEPLVVKNNVVNFFLEPYKLKVIKVTSN